MKIGIISDIHEDYPGLQRALSLLHQKGCDEIICLGDIAGYSFPFFRFEESRDASACIDLIKKNCSIIIKGNHDLYACRSIPDSNPGFNYPDDWYQLDFSSRQALARNEIWLYEDTELESNLTEEDKEFISLLPEVKKVEIQGKRILFSHFLYPDLTGSAKIFLPDDKLVQSHIKFMEDQDCDLAFFGHSHVQGLWCLQNENHYIKRIIKLRNATISTAIGVPCIANGKNEPGFTVFNTEEEVTESVKLYPFFKRIFN